MNIKKILIYSLLIVPIVIYQVCTFKVGPCSPEMERTMNENDEDL